jgi:hypothetical protein
MERGLVKGLGDLEFGLRIADCGWGARWGLGSLRRSQYIGNTIEVAGYSFGVMLGYCLEG